MSNSSVFHCIDIKLKQLSHQSYYTYICGIVYLCCFVYSYLAISFLILYYNITWLTVTPSNTDDNNAINNSDTSSQYTGEVVAYIAGCLLSYFTSDNFGRKESVLLGTVASTLSLLYGPLVKWCHVNKSILAFSQGLIITTIPVYLSEISHEECRGKVLLLIIFARVVGALAAITVYMCMQVYMHMHMQVYAYNTQLVVLAVVPIVASLVSCLGLMHSIPESPRWILARRVPMQAMGVLHRLHKRYTKAEFSLLWLHISQDAMLGDGFLEVLQSNGIILRMTVSVLLQLAAQLLFLTISHGITPVISSAITGTKVMDGCYKLIDAIPYIITGATGCVYGCAHVDSIGRKPLLLHGCIAMCVALGSYLGSSHIPGVSEVSWLLFTLAYSYSLFTVPFVLSHEIFPHRAISKISSIHSIVTTASWFVTMHYLRYTRDAHPFHLSMLLSLLVVVALVTHFIIPETNGARLEEMDDLFYVCNTDDICRRYMLSKRVLKKKNFIALAANDGSSGPGASLSLHHQTDQLNQQPFIEPSTLHKYSSGMRNAKFIVPSINTSNNNNNNSSNIKMLNVSNDMEDRAVDDWSNAQSVRPNGPFSIIPELI